MTANLLQFEEAAREQGFRAVAGIDEAGRGPLAGPVVAAACILPQSYVIDGINDSKKLTANQRRKAYDRLTADPAVRYGIGIVDEITIDEINILQATIQAMHLAVQQLDPLPDFFLVDGLSLPGLSIPGQKIIKGDSLSASIGAASILAKVTRDVMAAEWETKWPQYGFASHKGYGTTKHREAIAQHGPCPIHRKTFEPIRSYLT